jgi:hypothetical protein
MPWSVQLSDNMNFGMRFSMWLRTALTRRHESGAANPRRMNIGSAEKSRR